MEFARQIFGEPNSKSILKAKNETHFYVDPENLNVEKWKSLRDLCEPHMKFTYILTIKHCFLKTRRNLKSE